MNKFNRFYIGTPASYNLCDYSDKDFSVDFWLREEIECEGRKFSRFGVLIDAEHYEDFKDAEYRYPLEAAEAALEILEKKFWLNSDGQRLKNILIPYLTKWEKEDRRDILEDKIKNLKEDLRFLEGHLEDVNLEIEESKENEQPNL